MRKLLLTLTLLLLSSTYLFAQESVGFSDPDDIQPLLEYRLPAWGFSNLFFDFSMSGNSVSTDQDENSAFNNQFSGNMAPVYLRYRESESRVSSMNIRPVLVFNRQSSESITGIEQELNFTRFNPNWNFRERFYKADSDIFYQGDYSGYLFLERRKDETISQGTTVNDELFRERRFSNDLLVGVGYGRLRNVTPMIRSLRMNERLNELNTGQSMSTEDLYGAAEHFARSTGYEQTYDRPLKQFWNDMDDAVSPNLSALSPFDLLYLTDTSLETVGQRLEGWEVIASAGFHHSVFYSRTENNMISETSSQLNRFTSFIPTINGSWYQNLSLNTQVSVRGRFAYEIPIDDSGRDNLYDLLANANWLYTITDRVYTNSTVSFQRRSSTLSLTSFGLGSNINYFLENRFSFFAGAALSFQRLETNFSSQKLRLFSFDAGVRYHLKRGLF